MQTKSKLTLIVDGNWLLMSRWSVLNKKYADDESMCRELQSMLIKSINVVLRTFPSIDNIIFVSDGGSWRNKLPIPKFIKDEYKGNRELAADVNWDLIFQYYEDLINLMRNNNITTCHVSGVEGDDWCWYWSTKLNSEGTNVIIWSMDKDLTQLVKTNKTNGVFTICWNKTAATIEKGDYSHTEELDFFFGDLNKDNNEKYLHEVIARSSKVIQINPNEIVVDKIIRGDKGDNIFPVILKQSKTNAEKTFRVSSKDLNLDLDIHNDSEVKQYINNIVSLPSYKDKIVKKIGDEYIAKTTDEIFEHFKYNTKLVALEKNSYPDEILEAMTSYNGYTVNKNISSISSYINAKNNQLESVLEAI